MTDGTDRGDKIIIMLAREMYIMIIVEGVMTYTAMKEMWECVQISSFCLHSVFVCVCVSVCQKG